MDIQLAIRQKYRFPSSKGGLTLEQLWELPLQSKTGFDLDSVAKDVNQMLKAEAEDSFVVPANNTRKQALENMLAIVVHVIKTRQAENAAAANAAQRRAQRDQLNEILHMRTQEDLMKKSPEEIKAMLAALDTAEEAPVVPAE